MKAKREPATPSTRSRSPTSRITLPSGSLAAPVSPRSAALSPSASGRADAVATPLKEEAEGVSPQKAEDDTTPSPPPRPSPTAAASRSAYPKFFDKLKERVVVFAMAFTEPGWGGYQGESVRGKERTANTLMKNIGEAMPHCQGHFREDLVDDLKGFASVVSAAKLLFKHCRKPSRLASSQETDLWEDIDKINTFVVKYGSIDTTGVPKVSVEPELYKIMVRVGLDR